MSPITENDLDRLADYTAGALDRAEADEVRRLIATEPAWAGAHEALLAVQPRLAEALAGLPPEPVPADVAARLDRAIAAVAREADAGSAEVDSTAHESDSAKVIQLDRRRRWSRVALGTAAAVAVVAAGVAGVTALNHSNTTYSSSAGSSVPGPDAKRAAGLPSRPSVAMLASGTDYTHGTLALAESRPTPGSAPGAGSGLDTPNAAEPHADQAEGPLDYPLELQRLADPGALDSCLVAIGSAEGGGQAISVDFARYQGQPALIVALAGGSARVVAVGPDCGLAGSGAALLDGLS